MWENVWQIYRALPAVVWLFPLNSEQVRLLVHLRSGRSPESEGLGVASEGAGTYSASDQPSLSNSFACPGGRMPLLWGKCPAGWFPWVSKSTWKPVFRVRTLEHPCPGVQNAGPASFLPPLL